MGEGIEAGGDGVDSGGVLVRSCVGRREGNGRGRGKVPVKCTS